MSWSTFPRASNPIPRRPCPRSPAKSSAPEVSRQWLTLSGPLSPASWPAAIPRRWSPPRSTKGCSSALQSRFSSSILRIYRSADLRGLEVAGALKNVMAIASGMINGLGYGFNTTASLVTRANMEISRLGVAWEPAGNLLGVGGIGDLMLTCFGPLSRNFQLAGRSPWARRSPRRRATPMVAEGVETTRRSSGSPNSWPSTCRSPGRCTACSSPARTCAWPSTT